MIDKTIIYIETMVVHAWPAVCSLSVHAYIVHMP